MPEARRLIPKVRCGEFILDSISAEARHLPMGPGPTITICHSESRCKRGEEPALQRWSRFNPEHGQLLGRKFSSTCLDALYLFPHRTNSFQEMPCLPILFIVRALRVRGQRDSLHALNRFLRNDVPAIFMNHVSRQKIKRPARIPPPLPASQRTCISRTQFAGRRFHLHRHKMSRPSGDQVVSLHLAPRLRDRQAMLRRTHHETQLRPFSAKFLIADNSLSFFHWLPLNNCSAHSSPKTRTAQAQRGVRRCFYSIHPEYQIGRGRPAKFQTLYSEGNQRDRRKCTCLGA